MGMNGAESLVATLAGGGVEVCFTNPGTSEMHIVAALDGEPRIRCVLALFEGVATGAADGYARMAGKPACTLLHLGPGLANGLANLHNASKARTPIVNIVGQHATPHLRFETPLKSDIAAIAGTYSNWVRTAQASFSIGRDTRDAILAARTPPGKIATLIVPADYAWTAGGEPGCIAELPVARAVGPAAIERAATMLKSGAPTCLMLAGNALYGAGLVAAGRIAVATGAKLFSPYPFARMERGAQAALVMRTPYIFEQAALAFKECRQMILVGTEAPRSYFAHPVKGTTPTPEECEIFALAMPGDDYASALEKLAGAVGVSPAVSLARQVERPVIPNGAITLKGLSSAIAAVLPEHAIVVEESMTSGHGLMEATASVGPHDLLANTGGSIGIAMPLAVGAAVACPERRVLCLSADGSGMYTAQALWTMAREKLKVTTVIYANRVYGVLKREFASLELGEAGPRALDMFEIGRPDLDWVALAKGMGVAAIRVCEGFAREGPSLIQVNL
jgi:acetolactate synthase-1/2/3 large subunit